MKRRFKLFLFPKNIFSVRARVFPPRKGKAKTQHFTATSLLRLFPLVACCKPLFQHTSPSFSYLRVYLPLAATRSQRPPWMMAGRDSCVQAGSLYRWKQRRWWWSTKTGLFFYAPPPSRLTGVEFAKRKAVKCYTNVRSTLTPKVSLFRKHKSSPPSFVESLSLVVYHHQCSFPLPAVSLPFSRIEKQVGVSARVCTVISSSSSKNQTSESSHILLAVEKNIFWTTRCLRTYVPWRVSVRVCLGCIRANIDVGCWKEGRAQRCTRVSGF